MKTFKEKILEESQSYSDKNEKIFPWSERYFKSKKTVPDMPDNNSAINLTEKTSDKAISTIPETSAITAGPNEKSFSDMIHNEYDNNVGAKEYKL